MRKHSLSWWRRHGGGNMRGLGHITSGVRKERKKYSAPFLLSPFLLSLGPECMDVSAYM